MTSRTNPFQSDHFTLHQLAEGVFAAIAKNGGAAIANAGIIDLGGRTLVYDTFLTPQAALDLLVAARQVTGREPELIVNSHYHNDHIWGNQVFKGATFISTTQTRQLILTDGKEEWEYYRDNCEPQLQKYRQLMEAESEPEKKRNILVWLDYYEALVESFPRMELYLPQMTFDQRLLLHGLTRSVELVSYGGGHTGSDAMLLLPEEKILFMSDLLFVKNHPFLADGDPAANYAILEKVKQLDVRTLVPGHGPVGDKRDLDLMQRYITELREMVASLIAQGKPVEEASEMAIPARYRAWDLPGMFPFNLTFFYNLQQGEK